MSTTVTDAAPVPLTSTAGTARLARSGRQHVGWLFACLALLAATCLASLMIGALPIAPDTSLRVLLSPDGSEASQVITELRLPRTVLGIAVGCALGVAGALIQALTRNPLADPGILGVNAGAGLAVVVGITFFGVQTVGGYVWFALIGAIAATAAVYAIGTMNPGRSVRPAVLLLAGVALGAVMQGIASGISLLHSETFDAVRYWQAGSLIGRDLASVAVVLPFLGIGLILAGLVPGALNAIALGDEPAVALGVRVGLVRVAVVLSVTLLCGAATAACGPIGFIGLMVPHTVRWLFGVDQRWILAFTVILAPVLLLISDIVARLIVWPGEMPVGIVTAFIGAPVLLLLVRRRSAVGL